MSYSFVTVMSMGFPRQEYWSGLPIPSPGDLPNPGIEPMSPTLTGGFSYQPLGKPQKINICSLKKSEKI